jgi:hypothetical protein
MTRSWFGGDTSKAHWNVSPKDDPRTYRYKTPEERAAAKVVNRERYEATKRYAGKTAWYFQYNVNDAKQKAAQKVSADALAKELEDELGFPFNVAEGCFL